MKHLSEFFRSLITGFRKRRKIAQARRKRIKELRDRDPFIY